MDAKSEILGNIKAALAQSQDGPAPEPTRDYRRETENAPGSDPVVEEMVEALIDYTAEVKVVNEDQAADAIAEYLTALDAKRVVLPPELPEAWAQAAGRDGRETVVDHRDAPLSNHELDAVDAVLTGSRCGISLSGTIILDGEGDQGRRAISLVPDSHICVLRAKDIYPTVPQALDLLAQNPERPQTWFAGPSATSDIELIRVDGVHGPRNLRVVIIR
ncbi:lactate utilization protein B/C [Boudabousia liubingyangii]|uniref:Lactate utilization protein B/C n=1 Tax=Boudabousia liubingyangii TaxID=1921764 RepID=A0A1Q5PLC7_9ACTO|nr:lactate utilization protein C [Boudabousia liubingyangii]OKL47865.1 lactate utilization protein B/C [Boudabousia liubingyangii]